MLRRTPTALALAALLAASPAAYADDARTPRTISLSGHGEVKAAPDMAAVTSGVVSQGATAAQALDANTRAMNAVLQALADAGIAAQDIQTSNFNVQPRYDYGNNAQPPTLAGYDVSNSVTVTVRDLGGLGALLDTMVKSGANQINGIAFQVSKPDAALDEARKHAVEDATRKARLYAAAMAVGLGPVMSISEGVTYEPPLPVRAKAMAAESMPVPIAAGQQTLSVDVNVIWEIR
jgi:hypothetical protein